MTRGPEEGTEEGVEAGMVPHPTGGVPHKTAVYGFWQPPETWRSAANCRFGAPDLALIRKLLQANLTANAMGRPSQPGKTAHTDGAERGHEIVAEGVYKDVYGNELIVLMSVHRFAYGRVAD